MKNALEINGLTKAYGQITALYNIVLNVQEGAIYGLV